MRVSGIFHNFLNRRQSIIDRAQSVLAQRCHTKFDGFLTNENAGSAVVDHFPDGIRDFEEFIDALAAFVARLVAGFAAFSIV